MKKFTFFLSALLISMMSFAGEATISFADKAQRTEFSEEKQVWTQNGLIVTNNKAASKNAVGDYANPARFYQGSALTIECTLGNITKIVIDGNSGKPVAGIQKSIGAEATLDGNIVTVIPTAVSNSYSIANFSAQVRVNSITVTYEAGEGGETPDPTPDPEEPEEPVVPEVPENLGAKTIAEFLELKNTTDTCVLTGVVANIANTTYGNFDLVDATGSVYVYGLLTAAGESKQFASMDIAAGDTLTVKAIYNEYNGNPQAKNAIYVSHTKAATPIVPENLGAKTIAEFLELKNTTDTCVLTGVVSNIVSTEYGNFDLVDATGKVYVYGLLTAAGVSKQFASMDIAEGDALTVKAIYNEYNGKPQVKNAIYVSHTKNATPEPEPEPDPTPDPEEPETPGEGSDNVTYVFADDTSNPGNGGDWLTGTIDAYSTWTATKGGNNNPKYYDSGTGLRVYNGGTFTITSTKLIETITLTFSTSGYTFSADNTETPQTVTVNANSYEWSVGRTCRLQKIEITYGNSDVTIVKTLKSIALSGMTTIYETGDVFNFNGTCIATYAVTKDDIAQDEEQKEVTPTSVSEPDMTTAGEKEVIVTYTEDDVTVTATYTITVNLAEGDKLVLETTGVEGAVYADWSNVEGASGAVYAGNSAGGNNSIQLRKSASDKPAAGIITTTSGGLISKVKVSWNINTADGRTLNVYGKNTAYTAVSELYDAATAGELLGTIVEGTSTELVIDGDFEYVGIVSASGALYLDKVVFVWEENETPDGPGTALDNITIDTNITKTIVNGQLIIIKNGVKYNVAGAVVK